MGVEDQPRDEDWPAACDWFDPGNPGDSAGIFYMVSIILAAIPGYLLEYKDLKSIIHRTFILSVIILCRLVLRQTLTVFDKRIDTLVWIHIRDWPIPT
jgi:hypothetical protein